MFHEATIKFKINHQKNKKDAEKIVQNIINDIKEYEKSAIVFIEKPELINIEEKGINCLECKYCYHEEVIIGDRGNGVETMIKSLCKYTNKEITPIMIDFCKHYTIGEDS